MAATVPPQLPVRDDGAVELVATAHDATDDDDEAGALLPPAATAAARATATATAAARATATAATATATATAPVTHGSGAADATNDTADDDDGDDDGDGDGLHARPPAALAGGCLRTCGGRVTPTRGAAAWGVGLAVVALGVIAGGTAGGLRASASGHPAPLPSPSSSPRPPEPSHAPRTLCVPYSLHVAGNQQHAACVQAVAPGAFANGTGWVLARARHGAPGGASTASTATFPSFLALPSGHAAVPGIAGQVIVMSDAAAAVRSSGATAGGGGGSVPWPAASVINSTYTDGAPYAFVLGQSLHAVHVHEAAGVSPAVAWWSTTASFGGILNACMLWAAVVTRGSDGGDHVVVAAWAPLVLGNDTHGGCHVASATTEWGTASATVTVRQLPQLPTGIALATTTVVCDAAAGTCRLPSVTWRAATLPRALRNATRDGHAVVAPFGLQLSPTALLPPNDTHVTLFTWRATHGVAAEPGLLALRDTGWTDFEQLSVAVDATWAPAAAVTETVVDLVTAQLYTVVTAVVTVPTFMLVARVVCVPLANTSAPCRGWSNDSFATLPLPFPSSSSMCMAVGPLPDAPAGRPARDEPGALLYVTMSSASAGSRGVVQAAVAVLNATSGALLDVLQYATPGDVRTSLAPSSCPTVVRDGLAPGRHALLVLAANATLLVLDATPGALARRGVLWAADMCGADCDAPSALTAPAYTEYVALDRGGNVLAATWHAADIGPNGHPLGLSALVRP